MGQRFIKEGEGWRLGWDDQGAAYQGLLAGSHWAIELTHQEFQDFCRLAQQLEENMAAIASELMDEERLTCEAESETLWLEAEGFPQQFALRFILQSGRRCEGGWPSETAQEILRAISQLTLF